jgi:hypothetical protein
MQLAGGTGKRQGFSGAIAGTERGTYALAQFPGSGGYTHEGREISAAA